MRARWWLIGVVSAIALGATGCGEPAAPVHKQPGRSGDHTALTAAVRARVRIINGMDDSQPPQPMTPAVRRHAVAASIRLVTSAIVPPGSRDVARLAGKDLSGPAQVSACDPIVDATTLWLIRGPASRLTAFLLDHVPPGMRNDETGSLSSGGVTTSYSVADVPLGKHPSQRTLVFTFASVGRATGLRVDALTIPSPAICMSAGGGAEAAGSSLAATGNG
jgi:hypothetical protein